MQECLYLGNLDAKRDWGHAKDYVEMQWLMLQQKKPDDFIIATGSQYSVRDFVNKAAQELGINLVWSGKSINEQAKYNNKIVIKIDPIYFRPAEVDSLLGDASKAKDKLNWKPKISFDQLVKEMVEYDFQIAKKEKT
jgi:GDPmannose 4,6-dehydratase